MQDELREALVQARGHAVKSGSHPTTKKHAQACLASINRALDLMYPEKSEPLDLFAGNVTVAEGSGTTEEE